MILLPEIAPLLAEDGIADLGSGTPNLAMRAQLQQLERELPAKAKSREFALACVAGLWLYHDFLDESHNISQDLGTAEGSFWHAIMHRREGDFWNSKYWFRRCPQHPIFSELSNQAASLTGEAPKTWDPFAFVDRCEAVADEASVQLCRHIQRCEWDLLFQFCHERAFG